MKESQFASRLQRLGTESAFEVLAHARALEAQGREVVHLEIGEPDYATPANIIDAAVKAMRDGATHYTPASGIREVREATARYITKRTGVETRMENIVLTPGSKNLLYFTLLALVERGDEVIIPDPGYPIYRSLVDFIGGVAISAPIRESNEFRLDVEELKTLVSPKTKLLIVNSPANPTGGVLTEDDCKAIAELAVERDLVVLTDEIYGRLIYGGTHASVYTQPGMPERTILMDGLSKAWAMCGWRLGFGAMPTEIARWMDTLMINTSSCAASFTQWAAVEAFESPESDQAVIDMCADFEQRRNVLVDGLNAIPNVTCRKPVGAFYVFPNISKTGWDDKELARAILDEVGVAVLAGTAFGPGGEGYLRLSYANSIENIRTALDRIGTFLNSPVPA
jgi:aspartate/methionine/tyrosine aminotransferase